MTNLASRDDLGDRMKVYEARETSRRFLPLLPIYARIDGRSFSAFTRGMGRPFDRRMSDAMVQIGPKGGHKVMWDFGVVA